MMCGSLKNCFTTEQLYDVGLPDRQLSKVLYEHQNIHCKPPYLNLPV